MLSRITQCLAVACLIMGIAYAADDPFCGEWKLNKGKSTFTGRQFKVEDLGNNTFRFTSGTGSDTVVANGTDQNLRFGNTMSLTREGPNVLRMIIKKDGKVLSSMTHTLSDDGRTQTIKGTDSKPDGSKADFEVIDKRVGSGSGWSGTWESADVNFDSPDEWQISTFGTEGLRFYTPAYQDTLKMNFDGKDYTEEGPTVAPESTSSGTRVDAHTLNITDKVKGKVVDRAKYEVSPDGRTLTLTIHQTGQQKPLIVVFDKKQ